MDNYIEYIATGKCNSFQNIFMTAVEADLLVEINSTEVSTDDYTWVYGTKFVQFDTIPEDGDRVRITNEAYVVDPDEDLEALAIDVAANTADIVTIQAEQVAQDTITAQNLALIVAQDTVDIAHAASINALSTDYATHESRLDGLDTSTGITEAKAQQNKEDIATLSDQSSEVSALDVRMTAAEAAIVVIEGNELTTASAISDLEDNVLALQNADDSLTAGYNDIDNGVAVATDLTHGTGDVLTIDADSSHTENLFVEIERYTDDERRHTYIELLFQWNGTEWAFDRIDTTAITGAHDGVTFTIVNDAPTNTCALHYISDTMAGANYVGTFRYRLQKIKHTL